MTRAQLVTPGGAITNAADDQRTGWYPNQPNLTPALVGGGTFGRLWKTTLPTAGEQIYAQPLLVGTSVLVVSEANNVYLLDSETGAVKRSRALGIAWSPQDLGCSDLLPTVGITGTPVVDVASNTAFFFSKTYVNGTRSSDPANTAWYAHAVDTTTLAERTGFPVRITGTAANDPSLTFNAFTQHQRPALLLMNGVVYAAFGAHCDLGDYRGWVVGVSTGGQLKTLFATEAGANHGRGSAIWQPGGGLVSDGSGRIFFSTGNTINSPNGSTPQASPSGSLGESVVRLQVQSNGTLQAQDFFSPSDRAVLDSNDSDFGSGAPVALPSTPFSTSSATHLLVAGGKQGLLYVLNRDGLGGFKMGSGGGNASLGATMTAAKIYSRPAVWPGDGGYLYVITSNGPMQALKWGVGGNGAPAFSVAGQTSDNFFGSGSPVVTSNGSSAGSALVWALFASSTGGPGQLRAYDAVPSSGTLRLRYQDSFGNHAKFSMPGVGDGRIYVGTLDGTVLGYGAPAGPPISGAPVDFGTVRVGTSSSKTVTLTANQDLTVTALSISATGFTKATSSPPLPATLAKGATMTVPVTFSPTAAQTYTASLDVTTSVGPGAVALTGTGQAAGPSLSVSPTMLSFGGVARGSTRTASIVLSNVGGQALTWNGFTQPQSPFSVTGLPAVGSTLAAGASITVTAQFAPTANGSYSGTFAISSTGGNASVAMSGSAADPPVLTITPKSLDYGAVAIGGSKSLTFTVANTGGSDLTITKSKPPAMGTFVAETTLAEGTVIAAGQSRSESVRFSPAAATGYSDSWIITGDDSSGVQTVSFTGSGTSSAAAVAINAGGGAVGTFATDQAFSGGKTYVTTGTVTTSGVANAAPAAVYQSERYGVFTYAWTGLSAGASYTVRLHFAENWWSSAGARLINVALNGTTALADFDIYAAAGGGFKAVVRDLPATADSGGQIAVAFTASKDQAKVDGLELLGGAAPPPSSYRYRINSGGGAVAPFTADAAFTGGQVYVTNGTVATSGVANAAPAAVYQSERYGDCTYTFTGLTAGASYTVRLHFAENWWTSAGARLVNVTVNGTLAIANLDIYTAAGGSFKALVRDATTTADSAGKITVAFTASKDSAKVDGLEIIGP